MTIAFPEILLQSCVSSITSFLSSPSTVWFPITIVAVLAIIGVLALIYILGPLLGRSDISSWARTKVYDEVLAMVLIVVFLAFSVSLCTVQPADAFRSVGLLPQGCDPNLQTGTSTAAGLANQQGELNSFYGLAICNIYQFNSDLASFGDVLYATGVLVSIAPQVTVNPGLAQAYQAKYRGIGILFQVPLVPILPVHNYIIPALDALYAFILASEVLQFIIVSSAFLFSILMIIGLIARCFGVTRSFGGAMIALAFGLGFVYPLMTSITYGFLNTAIELAPNPGGTGIASLAAYIFGPSYVTSLISGSLSALSCGVGNTVKTVIGSGTQSGCIIPVLQVVIQLIKPFILYIGMFILGLSLIPLLNLVIVDTFVIDFSRVIGERIDFISLLTRIL